MISACQQSWALGQQQLHTPPAPSPHRTVQRQAAPAVCQARRGSVLQQQFGYFWLVEEAGQGESRHSSAGMLLISWSPCLRGGTGRAPLSGSWSSHGSTTYLEQRCCNALCSSHGSAEQRGEPLQGEGGGTSTAHQQRPGEAAPAHLLRWLQQSASVVS